MVEQLAIDRSCALFGAERSNVQPHSGAQANMAAYFSLLKPGDTVLGMRLDQGGHLTHGSPVNFSGRLYQFVAYGVDRETERIDYDEVERLAQEHKPKVIVAGYTAYPRSIDFARFREIADSVGRNADGGHGAHLRPHRRGRASLSPCRTRRWSPPRLTRLCAGQGARSSFPPRNWPARSTAPCSPKRRAAPSCTSSPPRAVAFGEAAKPEFRDYQQSVVDNARALAQGLTEGGLRVVSGGTDNHLVLVDVSPLGVTGQDAETALGKVNITVNKNAIPFDTKPPRVTSGLRLGTPSVSSRGFGVSEMGDVARLIVRTLSNPDDAGVEREVREDVEAITSRFAAPGL